MASSADSRYGKSPGFQGIRLTLHFSPASNFTTRFASSSESLTPPSITYSNIKYSQLRNGYFRQTPSNAASGYFRLMGINASRCASLDAFSDIASFGRSLSDASRSIPGTIPLVEIVTRFAGIPTPFGP